MDHELTARTVPAPAVAWDAGTPAIHGPRIYGASPGKELLYLIPTVGERPLHFTAKGLPSGLAVGAAFSGHLGVTTTSGPGVALKSETMSLAISLELPLVLVDIQRGGPSTGLPTKTEAADLNIAMFGRHGEAPLPIVAATLS